MSESTPRPCGVWAAAVTPLTGALEPDLPAFVRHCRWLLDRGCDGVVPIGTTGEGNCFSVSQRSGLIEAATASGLAMSRFIFGTGSCALADAVELTRRAVAAGAAGVLVLPPFYYKQPSLEGLERFYSELIERVGDARLRLYLYHFPQLSTVPIAPELVKRLTGQFPATVAGLKDSSGDWPYSQALLRDHPGFGVFSGSERFLLANLRAGGAGCISANVNITAPLARKVYAAWLARADDQAEASQKELDEVGAALDRFPLPAAVKYAMSAITGISGWNNLLPPNQPLTAEQGRGLMTSLAALPQMAPILRAAA